ncbi:hypothetical protein EUGRSUZ_G00810 [Eucalyptus grandis]|uniref:Uncharacterized protein n=2 Tax=Eucalyptus grandis TaxID=71139 RepID=A0ACC3K1D2_EUCGR|nr:hypothetical protein EUGRSUZ_G00810 [Eucalyptus grandis]
MILLASTSSLPANEMKHTSYTTILVASTSKGVNNRPMGSPNSRCIHYPKLYHTKYRRPQKPFVMDAHLRTQPYPFQQ